MAKEDYLIKFIQQLGRIIAMMAGLRKKNMPEESIKLADEAIGELLKQDMSSLLFMNKEEFKAFIEKENYRPSYLESLARLFEETGKAYKLKGDKKLTLSAYEKSLAMYALLNEADKTFSFEREEAVSTLQHYIDLHNQN